MLAKKTITKFLKTKPHCNVGTIEVEPDLLGVHVERGDELHVAYVVLAELHMHQAGHGAVLVGVVVVLDALDQRRRAVPDADNGNPNLGLRFRRLCRLVLTHAAFSLTLSAGDLVDVPRSRPAQRAFALCVRPRSAR
jgi:hypothetical protein